MYFFLFNVPPFSGHGEVISFQFASHKMSSDEQNFLLLNHGHPEDEKSGLTTTQEPPGNTSDNI